MKIVIWGTGYLASQYMERKSYHVNDEVVAFVDNNYAVWGDRFFDIVIVPPDKLEELEFDRLIVCTNYYEEIIQQIKTGIRIDCNKVITYHELEDEIKNELINKYKDSSDADIQKVLEYYKKESLNVFGFYEGKERTKHLVAYDVDGMPYINFENKRMYFPKSYKFSKLDNVEYVENVLYEQGEGSPHKYIESEDFIREGMVIVDAGVCEGNFALKYVENAKKLYLIESDTKWVEALRKTFEPYKDKVVICDKYLSGENTNDTITLDSLIKEKIDLLKMDIEGYEIDALKGGERVLRESNAYCAVCSYHKHGDELVISKLLNSYGYRTHTSGGYMFFPYDIWMEFRRGIVYGKK